MSPFRFTSYIISFAVVGIVTGILVNYLVDPYSVFGTKVFPEYGNMQERYLKIEYLKRHPDFNTFLIGSSRVGVVKTEDVDTYFSGAKTYNLSLAHGIPSEFEKYIEWLTNNIPKLSHVIVQIDWPSDYVGRSPEAALTDEVHPDISGRSRYVFLFDYLARTNLVAIREKINNNRGGLNRFAYDMTKGYWSRPLRDEKIEANCEEYVAHEWEFGSADRRPAQLDSDALNTTLASIARFKTLLAKHNVKLTLLLAPRNYRQIDPIRFSDYEVFITRLTGITDFHNFMYYNKLTKNDCNYYEASHYRTHVGEIVVRSLAQQPHTQSEMHQYVSDSSVESHLEFIKTNFLSERSSRFKNADAAH